MPGPPLHAFLCVSMARCFAFVPSLTALGTVQGGPLMQEDDYRRTEHFLWKALKFFLSLEAKSWILVLSSKHKVSLFQFGENVFLGWDSVVFTHDVC